MVSRLFQIIYILMENTVVTVEELANKLEVSERTIHRDMDKLSGAGIPIYSNRGRGGGFSLLPDYVLDKAALSFSQKEQIISSLQALSAVSLDKDNKDLKKLQTMLGFEEDEWIEVDFSSWGTPNKETDMFAVIKDAIIHCKYMEIIYHSTTSSGMKRKIKPLKLLFKQQAWYLYAYCEARNDYRYFKLRRIDEYSIKDETFQKERVGKLCGVSQPVKEMQRVKLLINKNMAFRAYDEFEIITENSDGDLICEFEVGDVEWLVGYVLSYCKDAKVLEPKELINKIKNHIEMMKEIYD